MAANSYTNDIIIADKHSQVELYRFGKFINAFTVLARMALWANLSGTITKHEGSGGSHPPFKSMGSAAV